MEPAHPTELRRLPEHGRLRITWDDGHVAEYGYNYLRGYCPCAQCQGHAVLEIRFHEPAQSVTAQEIEAVGNYAVCFRWSDGHSAGIYRFDFLRQICPCEACRTAPGNPAIQP